MVRRGGHARILRRRREECPTLNLAPTYQPLKHKHDSRNPQGAGTQSGTLEINKTLGTDGKIFDDEEDEDEDTDLSDEDEDDGELIAHGETETAQEVENDPFSSSV